MVTNLYSNRGTVHKRESTHDMIMHDKDEMSKCMLVCIATSLRATAACICAQKAEPLRHGLSCMYKD